MVVSIGVNWFLGLMIDRAAGIRRKQYLILGVVLNGGLLFAFKYAAFVLNNLGLLLKTGGFSLRIALPIGISFFTFQILSYLFDVYYQKAAVQRKPVPLALYIALFPQLIAGPIVRYQTVAEAIHHRIETPEAITQGIIRFVLGLGKKMLIANYAGFIADRIFALTGQLSVASAWLGAAAYTVQIFFDFSGYSDMAIGLGRVFGFHFLENFNYPYTARSITDFWRRWHISLSAWFRDYVYIPLGGSRGSRRKTLRNLLILWLLTGIWHGANWTFIAWGLFYFCLILVERRTGIAKKPPVFSRVYTLVAVIIGWVLFRSESLAAAGQYLGAMFGVNAAGFADETFRQYLTNGEWVLAAGILLSAPIGPWCRQKIAAVSAGGYEALSALGMLILFSLSVLVCIKSSYNPFLYFNF
jgi:D-alanyl-lipoteichoic acid acyltransferase DltB (MBOAT superfamily)